MMDEMTASTNGAEATAAMAEELVASGALDGLFSRIDSGEVQLTGEGGMLPAMIKAALRAWPAGRADRSPGIRQGRPGGETLPELA
jgi:putative transposase